ncbi:MAG: choice-of-anchor D domain-containing protein [Ilumatobacteraceae bacterium]
MSLSPTSSGRAGRCVLVALLAAASVGWIGEGSSSAAAAAELISVDPKTGGPLAAGGGAPSIAGDGNVVVFNTFAFLRTTLYTVYVRNRVTGTTTTIPLLPAAVSATTGTTGGVISRDGCHVAFWGLISSVVAAASWSIFEWDRCAGTAPVKFPSSQALGTTPGPLSVSADGKYIAYLYTFASGAAPKIARIDTTAVTESALAPGTFSNADSIDISDDGKFVAIGGQVPGVGVVLNEVVGWTPPCAGACTTEVISVGSSGQPASGYNDRPSVSADGRYVAFVSNSPDIFGAPPPVNQVFVRDRVSAVTKLVTDTPGQYIPAGIGVGEPDINPDGTQIALTEEDSGETSEVLVARTTSGYFDTASFDLVSVGVNDAPVSGGAGAGEPSISATGRYVAFSSSSNDQLSGGTVPLGATQVWLRTRSIQLGITPSIGFGTIDVGGQSPAKTAVITNTSVAEVNIASVTVPPGPFTITANSCGGVLPAGASCTVTMVFTPSAVGPASATLVVAGDGLSVSASLSGTGRTPTGPSPGFLKIKPISVSFGNAVVGTSLPAKTFVVSNPGQTAVTFASVALGGAGADQFSIDSNGCTGALAPAATCMIQVSATVTREGSLTATLTALATGGQSATATLRIGGEFTPTLKMNPGVVVPGGVTAAIGAGFPPNIDVQLAFEGETPFATVHTDGDGAFRFDYLLLRNGVRIGGRQVIVLDQPPLFTSVRAPLLIDLPTFRPSGFHSAQFTSGVRSFLTRGG